ncbi:MAG: right-handed parallel beta-helix repeat-containing protein [Myxococcota bacterium]|nr:right-handed parallel beta-helix repeat-containing protein [Myxococcota bacterium]
MRRAALLGAVVLGGCFADATSRVVAVDPTSGVNDASTPITISGHHLDVGVDERFDTEVLSIDRSYSARLGERDLTDVRWIDTQTISASVPAGLLPGTYDLLVVGPRRRLTLPRAFTVVSEVLRQDCAPEATRVVDAATLAAAVSSANSSPGEQQICVDAIITLTATLTMTDDLVLYGTPRGALAGDGLAPGATGLVIDGGDVRIEDLRFTTFSTLAVESDSGTLVVRRSVFVDCTEAIDGNTQIEVDRCTFDGGNGAAIRASSVRGAVVRIHHNIVANHARAVQVDDLDEIRIDNNTFHRLTDDALRVDFVAAVRVRNNIFNLFTGDAAELPGSTMAEPATANALTPAVACSSCIFGAGNPVVDCRLTDPDNGDFTLDATSPCIDAGVDVGSLFEGAAPDLGALESR